jgi:hypothetical protein
MFTKIGTILPGTIEKSGLAPKLAKARVLAMFEERVRAALPKEHAHAVRAMRLDDGTLTAACRSSAAAYALRAAEADIRAALEGAGVERVRVLLAPWR